MSFWEKLFQPKSNKITPIHPAIQLPEDFPINVEIFSGEKAIVGLEKLRQKGLREGFTPVILGNAEDIANTWENCCINQTPLEELLEIAKSIDVPDWLEERKGFDPGYYEALDGVWMEWFYEEESLLAIRDVRSNKYKAQVLIAKIPTNNSWEIPAYLGFGDWNDCPIPEEHVAISKYWKEKYDADIVAVTGSTVEYYVGRPPKNREHTKALAKEQFIFCADKIHNGMKTMKNLRSSLINNPIWRFWWS